MMDIYSSQYLKKIRKEYLKTKSKKRKAGLLGRQLKELSFS